MDAHSSSNMRRLWTASMAGSASTVGAVAEASSFLIVAADTERESERRRREGKGTGEKRWWRWAEGRKIRAFAAAPRYLNVHEMVEGISDKEADMERRESLSLSCELPCEYQAFYLSRAPHSLPAVNIHKYLGPQTNRETRRHSFQSGGGNHSNIFLIFFKIIFLFLFYCYYYYVYFLWARIEAAKVRCWAMRERRFL